ncbi:MAG: hypothetical protein WCP29_11095 [Acidobacteriota bacterium]
MDAIVSVVWIVAGLAVLLPEGPTAAQRPEAAAIDASRRETLDAAERQRVVNGALARLADPTMRSATSGPTPTLILDASSTAKLAGARIGIQLGDWLVDVKMQGLVDGAVHQATFWDLDGLRHKSTAEFGVLWTSYPPSIASAALHAACRDAERADPSLAPLQPCTMAALRGRSQDGAGDVPRAHRRPSTSTRNDCHDRLPAHVAGGARSALSPEGANTSPYLCVEALSDNVVSRLAPRRLFLAGVSYTVGPEEFSFASGPTAAGTSVTRVNWAVSGRAGLIIDGALSVGAEYVRSVAYQSADMRRVCVPIGTAGALECTDRVVGSPTRLRSHVATLEVRKFFGAAAINPRLSINPRTSSVSVEVPVYVLRGTKGGLTGGVRVGWRHSPSSGSTLEMSVFAGQVFGLIPR